MNNDLFVELKKSIDFIRSKGSVTTQEVKALISEFNKDLKILVDEKRAEIIHIVDNNEYSGFYQTDVKVPFNIRLHTFDSAFEKYIKAEKSFDVYKILTSELAKIEPLVKQVNMIKANQVQEMDSIFPTVNTVSGDVLKCADMIIDSIREDLMEICVKNAEILNKRSQRSDVTPDSLFKPEIERIRSVVLTKMNSINPKSIELINVKSGYDGAEGDWVVTEENGVRWNFNFHSFFAGGHFIQCFHTRTQINLKKLGS